MYYYVKWKWLLMFEIDTFEIKFSLLAIWELVGYLFRIPLRFIVTPLALLNYITF